MAGSAALDYVVPCLFCLVGGVMSSSRVRGLSVGGNGNGTLENSVLIYRFEAEWWPDKEHGRQLGLDKHT